MVGIYNHTACLRQKPKASSPPPNESTENKNPKSLATSHGLERTATFLLLPVAGDAFSLDIPNRKNGYQHPLSCP
jgi:hypothetical protein